tara:strand:+ start:699 stop:998 length:300 start_codon:yes stop_codon:yes gene_type:complete
MNQLQKWQFEIVDCRQLRDEELGENLVAIKTDKTFEYNQSNPPAEEGSRVYMMIDEKLIKALANDEDFLNSGLIIFASLDQLYDDQESKTLKKKYKVLL